MKVVREHSCLMKVESCNALQIKFPLSVKSCIHTFNLIGYYKMPKGKVDIICNSLLLKCHQT